MCRVGLPRLLCRELLPLALSCSGKAESTQQAVTARVSHTYTHTREWSPSSFLSQALSLLPKRMALGAPLSHKDLQVSSSEGFCPQLMPLSLGTGQGPGWGNQPSKTLQVVFFQPSTQHTASLHSLPNLKNPTCKLTSTDPSGLA